MMYQLTVAAASYASPAAVTGVMVYDNVATTTETDTMHHAIVCLFSTLDASVCKQNNSETKASNIASSACRKF